MAASLAGKTVFISGASRGIGLAIGLRAAQDGANVVIAAKTAQAHPKLPGTIYSAAEEINKAGGQGLPCIVDIRDEQQVVAAVAAAAEKFGGIDILINNASAISLTNTEQTPMKRFDLMMGVNTRGTYLCSQACLPFLKKGKNPHILNISPPLSMSPRWFKDHVAYTMAKYGMSMCVLGMAEEFRDYGIAVNALWPCTAIYTAAMQMLGGGDAIESQCRTAEIVAEAAHAILMKPSSYTGNFAIDEDVLRAEGETNFEKYSCVPGSALMPDFFLEDFPDGSASSPPSAASTDSDSAVSDSDVQAVFSSIEAMLSDALVAQMKAVFQFHLTDGGKHYVDLKNDSGAVGSGDSPAKADCVMKLSSAHFVSMFRGELQPTQAFFSGKLKISGNMASAMKLETLMKGMQKKAKL